MNFWNAKMMFCTSLCWRIWFSRVPNFSLPLLSKCWKYFHVFGNTLKRRVCSESGVSCARCQTGKLQTDVKLHLKRCARKFKNVQHLHFLRSLTRTQQAAVILNFYGYGEIRFRSSTYHVYGSMILLSVKCTNHNLLQWCRWAVWISFAAWSS